jgi:beta-lactamase class A
MVVLVIVQCAGFAARGAHGGTPLQVTGQTGLEAVQEKIKEMVAAARAETVAVAYYDFATGNQMLLNADDSFHAASTMKVPVMMEVFEQQKAGALNFDQRLAVRNDFISLADGSHYFISSESDSEKSLYEKIGQTATIRELMRVMIISSSNLAANILIEKVSAEKVMALMRRIGADHIKVLRGVEDGKAYDRGLNNTTTARDLMIIMRLIAERRAVSEAASDQMIHIMLDQKFNEAIPAGLPPNVRVAHKTGNITRINHDAAIVYPPNRKPYVLVVLTRGIESESVAHKLIADISSEVYQTLVAGPVQPQRTAPLNF